MIDNAFDAWKEGRHEGYFATEKTYSRYCFFDRSKPLVITFSMMGKYADRSLKGNDEIWSCIYFNKCLCRIFRALSLDKINVLLSTYARLILHSHLIFIVLH